MIERPILFKGRLVRAILDGRKTQTRRVLTVPWKGSTRTVPYEPYWVEEDGRLLVMDDYGTYHPVETHMRCPYGGPGDRLWVKETWSAPPPYDAEKPSLLTENTPIRYAVDGIVRGVSKRFVDANGCIATGKLRPSIFMPRWASRLDIEVTGIRVERLQDISEADAIAEGVARESGATGQTVRPGPRDVFRELWDSVNAGRGGWAANPWVWVVDFKRVAHERRAA